MHARPSCMAQHYMDAAQQLLTITMTQEDLNIADTYKQIAEAEKQALALEKMLDALDSKMDLILADIEQNNLETAQAKVAELQMEKSKLDSL